MGTGSPRKQIDWTLATLARLLRPVVRLALGAGVKHAQIEEVLRQTLVNEAASVLRERGGNPDNVSQLSVLTGLHRKDLTQRVRQADDGLQRTDDSLPSRLFTRWLQHVSADPAAWKLPLTAPQGELSFETLARQETRGNIHPKALLDELERLGVVRRTGKTVELNSDGFIPTGDLQSMLSFLGDNGRDHLMAGVENVQSGEPRFLERAIFTQGLSEQQCAEIQDAVRRKWAQWHAEIYADMLKAEESGPGEPGHRMRVGIYTFYEPAVREESPAGPPPDPPPV